MLARLILVLLACLAAGSVMAVVTPLPGVTPQRAPALTPFSVPIAVRVTDDAGRPAARANVWISVNFGLRFEPPVQQGCYLEFMSVLVCEARTDVDGIARFGIATPERAGPYRVLVQAIRGAYPNTTRLGEVNLELAADPSGPVARIELEGNDQRVVIGTALAPITVRLVAPDGRPRPGAKVWYSPFAAGGGGFELLPNGPSEVVTDGSGFARLPRFIASWGVGPHMAEVRYFDPESASLVTEPIRYTTTNAQGGFSLQLADLWWAGTAESGWGLSVFQHEDRLFNVWFVYGDDGAPTWYVQSSGKWTDGLGSFHDGALHSPRGAPWFAYDAARFEIGPPVGSAQMNFQGPESTHISFNDNRGALRQPFNRFIERQPFGRGVAAPVSGVGDLWWGGPSQNGWGVAIHEQAGTLFMVWFTYDAAGRPTWFVMPGGQWSGTTYAGTLFRTSGPSWTAPTFDASKVVATPVGSYELRFESTSRARLQVSLEGRTLVLPIERQGF